MRISDWSLDVCSSDLEHHRDKDKGEKQVDGRCDRRSGKKVADILEFAHPGDAVADPACLEIGQRQGHQEIGRASCRERGCQYVLISVVGGTLKKKNKRTKYLKSDTQDPHRART